MIPQLKATAANVIDTIVELPVVKAALADRAAAVTLQRSVQQKELSRLMRDWLKTSPNLEAVLAAAIAAVKEADRTALEARRALDKAAGAKAEAAARYTSSVDRLEDHLRSTANPLLAEFRTEMLTALEAARKAAGFATEVERNAITGIGTTRTRNNLTSVQRRIDAVRNAMAAAEEMALAEADQSVVPAKLAELRAALPIIDAELK